MECVYTYRTDRICAYIEACIRSHNSQKSPSKKLIITKNNNNR